MSRALCLIFASFLSASGAFPEQASRSAELKLAASYIVGEDLTSAETTLNQLLTRDPDDGVALNLLGIVRARQNKTAESEKLFQHAIRTGHAIPGPHINLARLYAQSRPGDAMEQLGQALHLAPDNSDALLLLHTVAREAAIHGTANPAFATSTLAKALSLAPDDPELLYDSGLVSLQLRHYKEAAASIGRALSLRPAYAEAQYALARVYLEDNQADKAEKAMRSYLEVKPNDATAQYGLGYILVAEQKLDQAKSAFQRSLALQPSQSESRFQLGEIAEEQGDANLARDNFLSALTYDPHHAGALTGLGILAYRKGQYEEAKATLEKAIRAARDYQKAHYYYALTLSKIGDKTQAEHEFEIARSLQRPHGEPSLAPLAQQ